MPLGLSPLVFHASHGGKYEKTFFEQISNFVHLVAAFALMFVYWKYLDMFQTIRYLALISIPLFLAGHRVLAILAARR